MKKEESIINFFEQELRNLFEDGKIIQSPAFVGRTCLGQLGGDLRVRAEFVTLGYADHYEALRLTVLNRTDGAVDKTTLRFKDTMGIKKIPGHPYFGSGLAPYIWDDRGEAEWYSYQPTAADRQALRQAANQYLDVFRERTQERVHDGPRMVYICAPLRGEVEKNIEFARQKAREVFQAGDIPVCPHLMFPPSSSQSPLCSVSVCDENSARSLAPPLPTEPATLGFGWVPENPVEDQAVREMGLRLVESCQQVNVYGLTWTEGMWAEIHHAQKLGIPVISGEKVRTSSQKRSTQRRDTR